MYFTMLIINGWIKEKVYMKIEGTPRERVMMTLDDCLRKNMEDGEAAKLKLRFGGECG